MWIEFGVIDYKILIPLIYPFFYQIRSILHENDEKALFGFFTNFCGYLLSGIILLIIKCRMRRIKSEDIEKTGIVLTDILSGKNNETELTTDDDRPIKFVKTFVITENQISINKKKLDKINLRNQYLFISLLVCIYLIPMFLDSYTALDNELNFGTSSSFSLFFCIIFYIGLSRLIIGEKINSHQIFSSIIIIVSTIIIVVLFLIKDNISNMIFLNIILIIVVTFFYSLFNTLEKKYFRMYMASPYHFMFMMGAMALTLILLYEIFTVIIFGFNCSFNGVFYQFYKNCEKHEYLYILLFIADIITAFIWLAGIQLTVYFFTPCHFIISESISQIISTFLNNTIADFSIGEKVITYILFIIIIFATLIYNEVVIINFFSLNKNTKKYINLRQLKETENLLSGMNNITEETDNKVNSRDSIN